MTKAPSQQSREGPVRSRGSRGFDRSGLESPARIFFSRGAGSDIVVFAMQRIVGRPDRYSLDPFSLWALGWIYFFLPDPLRVRVCSFPNVDPGRPAGPRGVACLAPGVRSRRPGAQVLRAAAHLLNSGGGVLSSYRLASLSSRASAYLLGGVRAAGSLPSAVRATPLLRPQRGPGPGAQHQFPRYRSRHSERPRQRASPSLRVRRDAANSAAILILPIRSRLASAAQIPPVLVSKGSPRSRSPREHLGQHHLFI
ncbi:hypothetical protein NDU88_004161 [Pleurodeles waltl]|uniref:Uncharacterized protein n=1 Tax=Pleurodeles waltl TaxID=8319 RepID=A0AAV7MSP4_PLEWA|nr:hypothetical protein NDU88_004161 [Pleurodeles waltl]